MTDDIEQLRKAAHAAQVAYEQLQSEMRAKQRTQGAAALEQIRTALAAEYTERLNRLAEARRVAAQQLAEAEGEAGKAKLSDYPSGIVAEWGLPRHSYGRGVKRLTDRRGVFEVCLPSTQFAANIGVYRRPSAGQVFVRLLKKDGTPGLGFASAGWNDNFDNWLPEGETPKTENAA